MRPPRLLPQPSELSASRSARSISLPASLTSSAASRASSAARSSPTSGSRSCVDSSRELRGELAHPSRVIAHGAASASARSRAAEPRIPLTNPGASAPQYSRARFTASSIATSTGSPSRIS